METELTVYQLLILPLKRNISYIHLIRFSAKLNEDL